MANSHDSSDDPADDHPLEPGTNPENVRSVTESEGEDIREAINETYDLRTVELKLPGSVVDAFEGFAEEQGISPRALMRQILSRYVDEHADD